MKAHLFLVQYTEFCLCYAGLFLRQAAGSSAATECTGMERSGHTIWPQHSSSYISGRHLQDSCAAVGGGGYLQGRDAFLMDAALIHLLFSPMTNGLISQLSHRHAILQFLLGIQPHCSLGLENDLSKISSLVLKLKAWRRTRQENSNEHSNSKPRKMRRRSNREHAARMKPRSSAISSRPVTQPVLYRKIIIYALI